MILQNFYKALSSKRDSTGNQLVSLLITITSSSQDGVYINPGNCELVIGSGRDEIDFTANQLQSPLNLTRQSNTQVHHSGNNLIAVTAVYQNQTESSVTVNEVGLSYSSYGVISRDVLPTGVVMAPNATHTFICYIKMSGDSYKSINNLYSLFHDGAIRSIDNVLRHMSDVSRKSDIAPIGTYDMYGSNDLMYHYGGGRGWWVDVGYSNTPLSTSDIDLGDGNLARKNASRTDILTCRGQSILSTSEPSYLIMEKFEGTFENTTEETLVIKEKGLFFGSGYYDNYRTYMMTREVLDTPISVAPGETVKVIGAIEFGVIQYPVITNVQVDVVNLIVSFTLPTVRCNYAKLVYKAGSAPQSVSDGTAVDVLGQSSATITELDPNTIYFVRIFVEYSSGRQVSSTAVRARTSVLPSIELTNYLSAHDFSDENLVSVYTGANPTPFYLHDSTFASHYGTGKNLRVQATRYSAYQVFSWDSEEYCIKNTACGTYNSAYYAIPLPQRIYKPYMIRFKAMFDRKDNTYVCLGVGQIKDGSLRQTQYTGIIWPDSSMSVNTWYEGKVKRSDGVTSQGGYTYYHMGDMEYIDYIVMEINSGIMYIKDIKIYYEDD